MKIKNKKVTIFGIICIVLGIAVVLGVFVANYNKKVEIDDANEQIIEEYNLASVEEQSEDSEDDEYSPYRVYTSKKIDGILEIPKIDLELPIFTKLTTSNLNQSACRVPNTEGPGCNNYCILGHYMRIYGVIFNRLNELEVGDQIIVETKTETYTYEVTDVYLTKGVNYDLFKDPEDENEHLITILTCDYSIKNGRRTVVGKLIN